jgi:hypothetical protein
MTVTQKPEDPAFIVATAMMNATKPHGGLHNELKAHAQDVAQTLIADIHANSAKGRELRAALGVVLSEPTRMGKNLRAAMDAYTAPQH